MALKKSRVRSGSFCTGVGSSRHYIQMLQAGPEETRPNEIDTCWLCPQSRMGRTTAFLRSLRMTEVRILLCRGSTKH